MPPLPAITYPSWNDLGDSVAQKISRSTNNSAHRTACSRTLHFLEFIDRYSLKSIYLSNDVSATSVIINRYTSYLLDGYTLDNIAVKASTVRAYLKVVNDHYVGLGFNPPFTKSASSIASKLLTDQKAYEQKPDQREPLPTRTIAKLRDLALADHQHGLRTSIWLWTALGRLGGFRIQEFAMDKADVIRVYVTPCGTRVVRAFTLKNFIFYDSDGSRIPTTTALESPDMVHRVGTEYDIQKNRMNGQIIVYNREPRFPQLCPVLLSISIVKLAVDLGASRPDDPLCLYRTEFGDVQYLTGEIITRYLRYATKLAFPKISKADLALISPHSIRVMACVLLHEAGKDASYIKLRLRWKSNCFEIYLRNTRRICQQHNDAIIDDNNALDQAISDITANLPAILNITADHVNISDDNYELPDDD